MSRLERVSQANPNYGQQGEPQYLQTTYYYDREVTVGSDDLVMNYYINPKGYVNETYFDLMGHKVMDWNKADTSDGDDADFEFMKTEYEYGDVRGLVTKVTRTDGTFEEYDYDIMGRPLTVEYFEEGSSASTEYLEYSYNDLGQIETQSSTVGATSHDTSYLYDRMGQTLSTWEGTWNNGEPDKVTDGLDIEYTYNKAGQVTGMNYNEHDIIYLYDDYGRIDEIQLDPETGDDNTVRKYFYDGTTGELNYTRDYRDFATVTGLGDYIQTDFSYNSAGLVTDIKYTDADLADANNTAGITEQYTVEYDGRGYIIGEQLGIDYSTTAAMETTYKAYEYDSIGRLVKAANGDTQETSWSNWDNLSEYEYDRVGNRVGMTARKDQDTDEYEYEYEYTQFNQIYTVTKNSELFESYEYDLRGNQTDVEQEYLEVTVGEVTTTYDKTTTYDYDLRNQMKEADISTPEADGQGNVTYNNEVSTNIYNEGGQRISKTEESTAEKYFYAGGATIYTQDNNGTMLTENILDLNGNIIASKRFDDDDNPSTPNDWEDQYFFYHYDIRGSVTAIVKPDGESVKEYTYDEFGNLDETGESSFDNEVTFTGSVTDTSTGLQYMNSRYYNPTTGTFLSQDSYTGNPYDPWTQHLYSYCGNNPVNMIDPTGHSFFSIIASVISTVSKAISTISKVTSKPQANKPSSTSKPESSSSESSGTSWWDIVKKLAGMWTSGNTSSEDDSKPASNPATPSTSTQPPKTPKPIRTIPLMPDEKELVSTVAGEALGTHNTMNYQAVTQVIINRTTDDESIYDVVSNGEFDAYGGRQYRLCMNYLEHRELGDIEQVDYYEELITAVMTTYDGRINDNIPDGITDFYSGGTQPDYWDDLNIVEVNIPGTDSFTWGARPN